MNRDNSISVRITIDTYNLVQEEKKKTGIPIIYTMDKAIKEYFDNRKKENN